MATDLRARAVGAYGERVAERYLREAGLHILDRNWRCPHGEIDIVARDGDCLVVCEVKTRRSTAFGAATEQITARKASRLRVLAGAWVAAHPEVAAATNGIRIDVVGVMCPGSGRPSVSHLTGVAS